MPFALAPPRRDPGNICAVTSKLPDNLAVIVCDHVFRVERRFFWLRGKMNASASYAATMITNSGLSRSSSLELVISWSETQP